MLKTESIAPLSKARPQIHRLEPEPDKVYADAGINGFRWSFQDELAAELAPGGVLRLEIIVRVAELRAHLDGERWHTSRCWR